MPFCMYTNYAVDILRSLLNKSRGTQSPYTKTCWGHNVTSFSLMFPHILIYLKYIIHHVSQRLFDTVMTIDECVFEGKV